MYYNSYRNMYRFLYSLFDGVTPVEKDCGVLCSAACCMGDANTGMLLFPHEETSLEIIKADGISIAVCSGKCERNERPLSCRIFPFFPFVNDDGTITPRVDPRAVNICPLARNYKNVRFDPLFIRRVKAAGRILAKDGECKDFMLGITKQAKEINLLQARISQKELRPVQHNQKL